MDKQRTNNPCNAITSEWIVHKQSNEQWPDKQQLYDYCDYPNFGGSVVFGENTALVRVFID